ncbi:MAG: guanylate kinase [Oscillospiraceae bacterium]|nr:guanylate kinase [Oscillospiraceae bacterium]
MKKGKLYIISGPSGCGKSTVLREVFRHRRNIFFSVSATTRGPREGEVDGKDYYFVTREEFERMIGADELLEHAQYVSNYYGTPRKPVEAMLSEGNDVVLDIEVQGAGQVKTKMPEAVSLFILPPSLEELERRLRGRGTETEEKIRSRLNQAEREIAKSGSYDYRVVNDDVERAAGEIVQIMRRIRRRK